MRVLNRIKEIRFERELSLRELERCSGVNYTTISKVENGYESPTQITMIAIARGLDMAVNEVFNLDWRKD